MDYWQRSRGTLLAVAAFGLGLVAWTLLLPHLGWFDALWRPAPPDPASTLGQVSSALSIVTLPVVVYPVLFTLASWSSRRQMTNLAGTLALSIALSFGAATVMRELLGRPRPDSPFSFLISQQGFSYPSPHLVAATTAAVMAFTLIATVRRRPGPVMAARVLGVVGVALVALVQLVLGAHRPTDLVGGILLGGLAVSVSNLTCGVHEPRPRPTADGRGRRAAIVYNPTKVTDQTVFKAFIERRFEEEGWEPPMWLSTTVDDPGRGMARLALDAGVDLVMVAGGDGTVRVVCGALANTGATLAIVPAGTGNLLARNMGIPVDAEQALRVALEGRTQAIDVLRVTSPGREDDHAAVMCGIGADAKLMNDTDEDLKKSLGVGAYVLAGLRNVDARPVATTVTIDGGQPIERDATLTMVCNVADLQAGLTLMPDATATDGRLDVLIASPKDQGEMASLVSAVVTGAREHRAMERHTGQRVTIRVEPEQLYEFDGDVIGEATELSFEVMPGALNLRVPR